MQRKFCKGIVLYQKQYIMKGYAINEKRLLEVEKTVDIQSRIIECIFTSDKRLEELVSQKAEPRNRSEQEIAA